MKHLLILLMSGLLILEHLIIWINIKSFSFFNECNTKKVFVSDDISLSVAGSRIVQLDYGNCNDVLYVPSLSYNIISVYQITHSSEGKIVDFSPHQVVIKALKDVRMS
jgi:hypothetical protein